MAHEVLLPQWSMGMQDGELLRWLKAPGDAVTAGEVLAEVEASKTVGEVVADRDGVLLAVLVQPGQVVPVRTVLGVIGAPGERYEGPTPRGATPTAGAPSQPASPALNTAPGTRVEATPVARKLARDRGLELTDIAGSGPGGRIVEADVRAALARPQTADDAGSYTLRGRRAVIARRMVQSLAGSAQLTLTRELDVTALAAARADLGVSWGEALAHGVARTLPAHPHLNGIVEGDRVTLAADVNLGVAVALDDGLVTPVIRGAHTLSLTDLADASRTLAQQARAGTLRDADTTGASFTISNLGAYGVDAFTPIIAPPQIAILGLGRVREVPARDGDALVWRQSLVASLTFDHRVTDGAPAALFLRDLATFLATPARW